MSTIPYFKNIEDTHDIYIERGKDCMKKFVNSSESTQ